MKKLLLSSALLGLMAAPGLAGSITEKISGCATKPIEGTNALQFVDPLCAARAGLIGAPGGATARPPLDPAVADAIRDIADGLTGRKS